MRDLLHHYPSPEPVGNSEFVFGVEDGQTTSLTKHEREFSDLIEDFAKAD